MNQPPQDISQLSAEQRAALEKLLQNKQAPGAAPTTDIPRRSGSEPAPLSFAQQRLWFLDQLDPGSAAYNLSAALRLNGPLDVAALERGLSEAIARHEALRTTLPAQNGEPVQVVAPAEPFHLSVRDLADVPADERDERIRQLAEEEAAQPFDLARGPLLRASLLRLEDERHIALLTLHHIIADGWSLGILFREMAAFYQAFSSGRPAKLPELTIQYADYAAWQREWMQGAVLEKQLNYWMERLGGARPLELPTDRPRPAVQSYRGASRTTPLPPPLIAAIKELTAREGVTPFMALLTAFAVLLGRYTNQDDIIIGAPVASRNRAEIEGLIGMFVNTLALRVDLSDDPPFRELLSRVRDATLGAQTHQDLPFERLVDELQPQRDLSHSPLVQVMFNILQAPTAAAAEIAGMTWSPMDVDRGAAQFDLTLSVDLDHQQRVFANYCTDLFDAATVDRLLGHYRTLLEATVAAPERRISQLPLMDDAERRRVLIEWNDTARGVPPGCLPQWFAAQAERTPRAVAVAAEDGDYTYAALEKRARQIAALLRGRGVGPGTIVGLCLERSRKMVAALLGVLHTGAAYLPLDPAFPRERLSFMLEDSGAALLLTAGAAAEGLRAPDVLNLDEATFADNPQSPSDAQRRPNPQSQDLAYVIYTSGSTGKPKGVAVTHGALANFLSAMRERPGLAAGEGLLAVTTLSFDIAALELFLPLIVGGRIELADRETAADGQRLLARLAELRPAVLQATPATWRLLLEAGWAASPGLRAWCGGEALPRELAAALLERVDPAGSGGEVWNLYGPTETTIWSSVERITDAAAPITIGRPLANTQFYILNRNLRPAPVGAAGELCIGGAGLAREYLGRPELTAERFIDWWADESADAERLYRTGDLARWLPDGRVECLGRLDHQVKVRGFRIELGEIEAALTAHPGVDRAIVAAREDGPPVGGRGGARLVAYLTSSQEPPPTVGDLRPFLREQLPEYMLPSSFVLLEEFPLTPNGKVDRRALPAPDSAQLASGRQFIAPRSSAERKVAAIWTEVLGVDRVGIHDNYFELGGNSLLATRLIARLRQAFDIELPLRSIFQESTVEGLARAIQRDADTGAYRYEDAAPHWDCLVPMQLSGARKPLFLVAGAYADEALFLRYLSNMIPHLGLDQPVYGFRPRGLDGKRDAHTSVEDMARDYIAEMRAAQPEGPYLIGGECVGGIVAYEMAQQLHAAGERVGLLVILDTHRPTWRLALRVRIYFRLSKLRRILDHFRTAVHLGFRKGGRKILNLARRKRSALLPVTRRDREFSRISHTESNYRKVLFRYRPRGYPGKLTILVNEQQYAADPVMGWQDIAQGALEIHKVPGDHITRLTVYPRETAQRLRACLDRVAESKRAAKPPAPSAAEKDSEKTFQQESEA